MDIFPLWLYLFPYLEEDILQDNLLTGDFSKAENSLSYVT